MHTPTQPHRTASPPAPQRTARHGTSRRGFTILELIVVLVVIGLLVLIAVPAYSSVTASADVRSARTSNENIARIVGASLKLDNSADPAAVLAIEANPLMNGAAFTVTEDTGAASYSTVSTDMNYAVSGGYLAWSAYSRDNSSAMCRVDTTSGNHDCWIHTGDADTHDGTTALAGP